MLMINKLLSSIRLLNAFWVTTQFSLSSIQGANILTQFTEMSPQLRLRCLGPFRSIDFLESNMRTNTCTRLYTLYKAGGKKASCPVLTDKRVKSPVYPFLFLGILHLLNFLLEKNNNNSLFIYLLNIKNDAYHCQQNLFRQMK